MKGNLTREALGMLLAVFVTLKLTGVVAWSWWWVLAPFWVPLIAGVLTLAWLGIEFARMRQFQSDWWFRR